VGSPLRNGVFTASGMLMEKVALSKQKNHISLDVVAELPLLLGFSCSCQLSSGPFCVNWGHQRHVILFQRGLKLEVAGAFHRLSCFFILQKINVLDG
jgi:hypothetical protein